MSHHTIALIAGEGKMALKTLETIQSEGKKVLLIALKGITSEYLANKADIVTWGYVTQIGKAIRACQRHNVTELVMVGRVHHNRIFALSLWRMDWITLKAFLKLFDKRTDSLLSAIADLFASSGITLVNSMKYLKKHVAMQGILTKKRPSRSILEDIEFGKVLAKEMGRLDVGQTVVVKNHTIVAVEAMEGTDQCLERAGTIAGKGCVVVKMSKPNQDMRFDVPVIGVNTIEKLAKIGAVAIAIEAEKTILIDDDILDVANHLGITIVSV